MLGEPRHSQEATKGTRAPGSGLPKRAHLGLFGRVLDLALPGAWAFCSPDSRTLPPPPGPGPAWREASGTMGVSRRRFVVACCHQRRVLARSKGLHQGQVLRPLRATEPKALKKVRTLLGDGDAQTSNAKPRDKPTGERLPKVWKRHGADDAEEAAAIEEEGSTLRHLRKAPPWRTRKRRFERCGEVLREGAGPCMEQRTGTATRNARWSRVTHCWSRSTGFDPQKGTTA